jgi:hypothetical protein
MSIGYFVDKDHPPSTEEIAAALGEKRALWDSLVQFIADSYQLAVEPSFGGKNYGWNLWYRKGGKSLVSLYPQQEGIVAQVVLGKAELEKAMALNLGEHVSKLLRETPRLHDGCWLFIPVTSEEDARDVQQLLLVKRRATKKTPGVVRSFGSPETPGV